MDQRQNLHQLLETIAENVYFQPPQNQKIVYPCIVYKRDRIEAHHADDRPYTLDTRYLVTVIDPHPDSDITKQVSELPKSLHNRFFTADGLNHDVFSVFV